MSLPKPNLAAILPTPKALAIPTQRPIPTPGPHELLIHNHAIAANWKIQQNDYYVSSYPTVLGSDVCGIIVAVGDEVANFQVGDRVTGFAAVIYNSDIDHGAWQTYTILKDIAAAKIPNRMTFEEGAIFPMAMATVCITLFVNLGIPKPPAVIENKGEVMLVWGASSSVGLAAVQVARAIGLTVWGTASPKNHELVKSVGASEVFDYRSPNVVSEILGTAEKAGVTITRVLDSISENGTLELASDVLVKGGKGGDMVTVLDWPEDLEKLKNVSLSQTAAYRTGADCAEIGAWFFNEWLQKAMEDGTVVPAQNIHIVEGGIGATQKAFDMLKAGVSATKLVIKP
jgi:NADPH:quinone reductase-like Zn-dependent oxidoreductase